MAISNVTSGAPPTSFTMISDVSGVIFGGGTGREGGSFGHTPTFDIYPSRSESTGTAVVACKNEKKGEC